MAQEREWKRAALNNLGDDCKRAKLSPGGVGYCRAPGYAIFIAGPLRTCTPACRDPGSGGHDRFCAQRGTVDPRRACCRLPAGIFHPGLGRPGLRHLRDARSL